MTYDLGYAKGCVYKIICKTDCEIVYIGSTFNKPSKRWEQHKNDYNKWINDPKKYSLSIYPYFRDIGIDNFKLIKIKEYEVYRADRLDRKHLSVYEQLWINKTKCVNKQAAFGLWKVLFEKERLKLYYQDNKDHIKELQKLYRENNKEQKKLYDEKNKEQIKEQKKLYNEKNKDHIKEQHKLYSEKNKEQISEQKKLYREKNKEQISERQKLYREKNKDKMKEKAKKYYQDTKVICPICLKESGKNNLKRHIGTQHP